MEASFVAIAIALLSLVGVGWQIRSNRGLTKSEEAVNWEALADKATLRSEKTRELLDTLREWQERATPLLRRCAEHNLDLAEEIYTLPGLNRKAKREADEVKMLDAEIAQGLSDQSYSPGSPGKGEKRK